MMKNEKSKDIAAIVLIVISIMIYSFLNVRVKDFQHFERYIIVEMQEQKNIQKNMNVDRNLILTGKGKETIVEEIYLEKEASGNLRYTDGNLHILLPDILNVDLGKMKNRCVISSSISYKLFGTDESVGMHIECEGKEYVIAGVTSYQLYSKDEIILSSVDCETCLFDRAGYIRNNQMTVKMAGQYLQNQYAIHGRIMDMHSILRIMKGLLVCYLAVAGFLVLFLLRRTTCTWEKTTCMIIVVVIFIYFILKQLGFSMEEFPSQWSDYEAWGNYFQQRIEAIKLFIDIRNQCMCSEITKSLFEILGGVCIAIPCLVNRWTLNRMGLKML